MVQVAQCELSVVWVMNQYIECEKPCSVTAKEQANYDEEDGTVNTQ